MLNNERIKVRIQSRGDIRMKLSEIQEGSKITLRLMTKDKKLQLDAVLKKHIRENIAIITLTCDTSKKTNLR